MISSSVEWTAIETTLLSKASALSNSKDLKRMICNIRHEINELSRAEVEARRGKKLRAETLLQEVNANITMVEEYLLVATLLG